MALISDEARFCSDSASDPSITYLISFLGNKYSRLSIFFSMDSSPSFLDIIEKSTKLLIRLFKLYFLGKYAIFISLRIFLNLSNPKPIIIAEKVPPKTIIRGGIRNNASNAPPSRKKAPKMERMPKTSPPNVPIFFIISNLTGI